MKQFIKKTESNLLQSKVIETREGLFVNSAYYDKSNFLSEPFENYKIGGNQYTLSLNRVANHPVLAGQNLNECYPYRTYGDMIVVDSEDSTIEYVVTHSSTLVLTAPLNVNNSTIAKIKTIDGVPELLKRNTSMPGNSTYAGTLTRFLGQSKKKLYYSGNMGGPYSSRVRVISIDKETLIPTVMLETSVDRENITFLRETFSSIYLIRRRNNSTSEVYVINKHMDTISLFGTIPLLEETVCGSTLMEPISIDDTNNYIIELNSGLTTTSYRWIDFQYEEFEAAFEEQGYPNVAGLKKEASFELISHLGYTASGTAPYCGLFDKKHGPEVWTDYANFYWYSSSHYIEIKINDTVNIWRTGVTGYPTSNGAFTIQKLNAATSVWDTVTITQTYEAVDHTKWNKFISNLAPGTYRFKYGGSPRMDSCWYIENANGDTIHTYEVDYKLLKMTVEDKTLELEEGQTFPGIPVGTLATRDSFAYKIDGRIYYNCATYGVTNHAWDTNQLHRNVVSTFLIDQSDKKIIYKDCTKLTEAVEASKAFLTNHSNEILLSSSSSTFSILRFDPELEKYITTKKVSKGAYSFGFDSSEDIWIMYRNYEVFKYGKEMIFDVVISYDGDGVPTYSNEPIDIELLISATNCFNEPMNGTVMVRCTDNAVFENNLNNIEVEVPKEGTVLRMKIINPGLLIIEPNIMTDLSNSKEE